jgi:hypothetical protein
MPIEKTEHEGVQHRLPGERQTMRSFARLPLFASVSTGAPAPALFGAGLLAIGRRLRERLSTDVKVG